MYYHPTGPIPTPFDYFTKFEFEKGFDLQEEAAQMMRDDIFYVAEQLYEVGCEAINLDTTGSAGDAEFWGALQVVEEIKSKLPDMPVEMGMAGEEVIGMHGKLTYKGERLAGMYPHQQVEMAAKAGVDIFGVAVNSDTGRSTPYNIARAVTYTGACQFGYGCGRYAHDAPSAGGLFHPVRKSIGRDRQSRRVVGGHRRFPRCGHSPDRIIMHGWHSNGRRSGRLDAVDSQNENRSGQGICIPKVGCEPAGPHQ